jgi:hypothetical protein
MSRFLRFLLLPGLLVVSACATSAPLVGTLPSPPAGTARIVLYRDIDIYEPSDVLTVSLNDREIGTVPRGDATYRDVPPGTYTVTFKPTRPSPHQFKTVTVVAGNVVYVKLQALSEGGCTGSETIGAGCYETGYTSVVIDPASAQQEIKSLRLVQG